MSPPASAPHLRRSRPAEDIEKNGSEFRQGAATWQAVAADLATGRWWVSPFHSFAMLLDIEEEGAHAWGLHPASDPAPHLRVRAAIAIAVNIASVRFRSNLRFMAPGPWRLARYTTNSPQLADRVTPETLRPKQWALSPGPEVPTLRSNPPYPLNRKL